MEYVIAIFGLGCIVTLVVAIGIVQAQDFARTELERQNAEIQTKKETNGLAG